MEEKAAAAVSQVGVIGAGTMGTGIAQLFLLAGCRVYLYDVIGSQTARAVETISANLKRPEIRQLSDECAVSLDHLTIVPNLVRFSTCDWIIETVVEDFETKEDVLRTLGRLTHPDTVLASNTSSLSITRLGSVSGRPERTVGMHFFNPAPVMQLVEVVGGLRTDPVVVSTACALARRLGKVPVTSRDRPGFLANRILAPMLNESFCALAEGVGSAEDIDRTAKLGLNHPMGPLELADLIGLDVCLAILEALHHELGDPRYRPCHMLRKYVEAGWLGRKSGRGFYIYPR